ncbi:hypothetical protein NUW54_g13036 [Trametes sanguinea]|uniref:Uncharacterized protein n=1 Tax=Trametes sanguinea TaxID=158606 RepID=A0ACC1MR36_9APHY|nr:hypothetical protein NUW54_g13036 [Trametes sanguinea]
MNIAMAPLLSTLSKGISPTLQWPVKFCLYNAAAAYILSIITGNVSQVDRVWTFLPTIYTAYYALLPLWPNTPRLFFFPYVPETVHPDLVQRFSPRALLMFGLVFIWMCRLTYNTWRRGLFNPNDEDYRWAILRQKIPTWLFQVFNLTFIDSSIHTKHHPLPAGLADPDCRCPAA